MTALLSTLAQDTAELLTLALTGQTERLTERLQERQLYLACAYTASQKEDAPPAATDEASRGNVAAHPTHDNCITSGGLPQD